MAKRKTIDKTVKNKVLDFAGLLRRSDIGVEKIIVYGSCAKGTATKDSDIDLCVISPDFARNPDYFFKKIWQLADKIDLSLEPIPFTKEELANKYSTLAAEIKKYGVRIV